MSGINASGPAADAAQLEAALDRLTAEKGRRLQARVDAGEPAPPVLEFVQDGDVITGGDPSSPLSPAEQLRKLDAAPSIPGRITHMVWVIVHAPPRAPNEFWKEPAPRCEQREKANENNDPVTHYTDVENIEESDDKPPAFADVAPTYFWIDTMPCIGDAGEIACAYWAIRDGVLVVTDERGEELGRERLRLGSDPAVVARQLLRKKHPRRRKIVMPDLGIA